MSSESEDFSLSEDSDNDFESDDDKSAKKDKATINARKAPAPAPAPTSKKTVQKTAQIQPQKSSALPINEKKRSIDKETLPSSVPSVSSHSNGDTMKGPPVTSEAAAKKLIIQYMTQQNRPYSAIQVFDNLHQRITKPVAQRVLDSLSSADDGVLSCKEYGKAKIYFLNQVSYDHLCSYFISLYEN